MTRWSITLIACMCYGAFAVAQQPDSEQPLSSDLVQWSYMQQPQQPEQSAPRQTPTPEPSPETQPAQNPTSPQSAQPAQPENATAAAGSQAQSPTAQTFTGIINKEADSFTLKVSETASYKLDNQQEVQQYEGKRVRVTGTLESSINLIHVDKIEPLS